MKISLRWVCDHLNIDWKKIDVTALVERFNTSIAEIEAVESYSVDFADYALGLVQKANADAYEVFIPEWKETRRLSVRTDAFEGRWYLIKKDGTARAWASPADFNVEKDGLLPAFSADKKSAMSGSWKKKAEPTDYILDVDNKSITHRPDLWSHRGFAREVAPFLKTTLRKEKEFFAAVPVKEVKNSFHATTSIPFSIEIETPACKRFAALYFDEVPYSPSALWMGLRLMKVGMRTIDFVVDATNYVMLDIGQPLHAYDASKLSRGTFGPRMARNGEQLTLLKGINLTLQETDMVIADATHALALAGIKGGQGSGITPQTRSVLLESATFDGGTVRLASSFHKIRTDGSARFEKEQDPYQNVSGITRFVKLLNEEGVATHHAPYIVSLGILPEDTVIEITQGFIEDRLGVSLEKGSVKRLLEPLGFKVSEKRLKAGSVFTVTVPSYRATKDIKIREDIVEEVGRLIGYTTVPELIPVFERQASHDGWVDRLLLAKNFLAFSGHLREVQNYAFLDNDFLKKIGWRVQRPVTLANPLAEQRTTLVDSLVVNLLQNVSEMSANYEQLGFFEWARIWSTVEGHPLYKVSEQKSVAGIWYQRKGTIDFYRMKDTLQDFFEALQIPVTWKSCVHRPQWAHSYQIADLVTGTTVIGKAGKVSTVIMNKLGGGDAFVFELDAQALLSYAPEKIVCKSLPKYQGSFLDISLMVPLSCTVEQLQQAIERADARIVHVQLQDVFQKPEWQDTKSMTFRFFVQDLTQTVTKELLEHIQKEVQKAVIAYGAQIR